MKHIILLTLCTFLIWNCTKKTITIDDNQVPPPQILVNFILVDSNGNNLLPHPLPDEPVVNPFSFKASSEISSDISSVSKSDLLNEYFFYMRENAGLYLESPTYQKDSSFSFYPCFENNCDTVYIRTHKFGHFHQSNMEVIWNNDTITNYRTDSILKIVNYGTPQQFIIP